MRLRLEPNRSVDCDDTTTPDRAGVWADRGYQLAPANAAIGLLLFETVDSEWQARTYGGRATVLID